MVRRSTLAVALVALVGACSLAGARSNPVALPNAKLDAPLAAGKDQVAVFAGGCFWGLEAVFEHVKGVKDVVSGYSGGSAMTAHYQVVGTGQTGHAESVRVVYDPKLISYGQLLKVYFSVAHDPTQLNRQAPDVGTQYRSEVFAASAEQQKLANAYIAQLTASKAFDAPIVTKVEPLKAFYPAEAYHQDYLSLHPNEPYIVYNDAPKLVHLKQLYPQMYKGS
ncbi:peptide-methionine (S)-S-oxide reductase MsrA [Thermomonas sp.]|uniref:peptide-methionine (S)-S-oxide reductase MsrA n=1 Tax=Thermomonas sp. TaxID=1971895 RepID=UPI00248771BE|nr:peptide-methionine (S)-S-oxide reductase MsrA [Thermomonas sp.]MDI1253938.1 peptide-methionine (S)-S-oxide reductase MsrA [Thermomonas sp.]